jgi:MFS family permease
MAVGMAVAPISQELSSSISLTQWIVSAYVLATASTIIPAGKLCDHYGYKAVFMYSMLSYAVFLFSCAFAKNIGWLIAFRAMDGISAACLMSSSIGVIQHQFEGVERTQFLAKWALFVGLGTIIGPVFGGWVLHYWQWRGIFLFNLPFFLIFIVYGYYHFPKTESKHAALKLTDIIKPLLAGAWVLSGLLVLTELTSSPFSYKFYGVLASFIILSLIGYCFILRKSNQSPFMQRIFISGTFAGFCSYFAMYAWLVFTPLWLMNDWHFNPQQVGNSLIPYSIMFVLIPLGLSKLAKHCSSKSLLLTGLTLNIVTFMLWAILGVKTGLAIAMIIFGLIGMANALINVPATAFALSNIPKNIGGVASGIVFSTRWVGASFGSTVAVLTWLNSHNPLLFISGITIIICMVSFISIWFSK